MSQSDLTDFEWSVIKPVLPTKVRGTKRVDDRMVLNGILWHLRTCAPWTAIPSCYGAYMTCANRYYRWRKAGVWKRMMTAISDAYLGDIRTINAIDGCGNLHEADAKPSASDPVAWAATGRGRQSLSAQRTQR